MNGERRTVTSLLSPATGLSDADAGCRDARADEGRSTPPDVGASARLHTTTREVRLPS